MIKKKNQKILKLEISKNIFKDTKNQSMVTFQNNFQKFDVF